MSGSVTNGPAPEIPHRSHVSVVLFYVGVLSASGSAVASSAAAIRAAPVGSGLPVGTGPVGAVVSDRKELHNTMAKKRRAPEPCKLCGHKRILQESHIVSEFFHKPTYEQEDGKSRKAFLLTNGLKTRKVIQKGLRDYLLCGQCEGQRNRHETPVSRVWQFPSGPVNKAVVPMDLRGKYVHVKLLLLSTIWLAAVSNKHWFSGMALDKHDENRIRDRLKEDQPGTSEDFPIVGRLLVEPKTRNVHDYVVASPVHEKIYGCDGWLCVFGGVAWFTTPHSSKLALQPGALPEVGAWPLPVWEYRSLKRLPEAFQ